MYYNLYYKKMVTIYASDLARNKRTDAFMGKGFEEMLKKAEENGEDIAVGEFYKNEDWRIE